MANHLRTVLAKVMGVERKAISDADIYGWLKKLDKADETLSDGLGGDAKFSRQPKVDNSKSAYESAKTAGETELTFHQWQQVRTPEFKAWFGDWENDPDNASTSRLRAAVS